MKVFPSLLIVAVFLFSLGGCQTQPREPMRDIATDLIVNNDQFATHIPGFVTLDWSTYRGSVESKFLEAERSKLSVSIFVNGIERYSNLPINQDSIRIPEPPIGQYDYYFVFKLSGTIIEISDPHIRTAFGSQIVEESTFKNQTDPENILGVEVNENLKREGIDTRLTQNAVKLGYKKVVWVLRPDADPKLREFIDAADRGVEVKFELNARNEPNFVTIRDRKTRHKLTALPKNFFFKVDAAFNGNAFFWDDMFVALATVPDNPWLARSTIEFWLDVQKINHGVIPREVRKSNLLSLWFDYSVKAGETPRTNLQYTNPYLMNWVAEELYAYNPSEENLELMHRVVDSMEEYLRWMEKNRSVYDSKGKFRGFNGNALGTGMDDSRGRRGNFMQPGAYQNVWADILSQSIAMLKSIATWEKIFAGKDIANSKDYLEHAAAAERKIQEYEKLLNEDYWSDAKDFYFDLIPDENFDLHQDRQYTCIAGFWPLFSATATPVQVHRLVATQLDVDHFGGDFPLPANARFSIRNTKGEKQSEFEKEDGYWTKWSHWPSMAAVTIEGFNRSGRPDISYDLSTKYLRGMASVSTDTVFEFYGEKREPSRIVAKEGNYPGHVIRKDFAGWGKVPPIYNLLRHVIGFRPQLDGTVEWDVFAEMNDGDSIGLRNVKFHGFNIKRIALERVNANKFKLFIEAKKKVAVKVALFRNAENKLVSLPRSVAVETHFQASP